MINWLLSLFLPLRYWTVYHNGHERMMTIRQRLHPGVENNYTRLGLVTVDGPHKTQEEAAQRLAFWRMQDGLKRERAKS